MKERIPGDRYEIDGILGKGGNSTVYTVKDNVLNVLRAAKFAKVSDLSQGKGEALLLSKIKHIALPEVYDYILCSEGSWTIFEKVEGSSILDILRERGRFSEDECIYIAIQLCDVLGYLHKQMPNAIIHGDLKPSNIMINSKNLIKLIDFGAAAFVNEFDSDSTSYMGTFGYAAPERISTGMISAKTDIYSLGKTLIHILTGCKPKDQIYTLHNSDYQAISPDLRKIIYKCVMYYPDDRYRDMAEVERDLKRLITAYTAKLRILKSTRKREREKIRLVKKSVISVVGNAEFACEVAYCAAKQIAIRVLLADLDWFSHKVPYIMEVEQTFNKMDNDREQIRKFLYEAGNHSCESTCNIISNITKMISCIENLTITCIPSIKSCKSQPAEGRLSKLIEMFRNDFDLIILSLPGIFTGNGIVEVILNSDVCIIPVRQDLISLMDFFAFIRILNSGHKAAIEKIYTVTYENEVALSDYQKMVSGNKTVCKYAGDIPYKKERGQHRDNGLFYARRFYKDIHKDYKKIFEKVGLYV